MNEPGIGSLNNRVVEAVADAEGVDSLDLETRLHSVIDADALERIVSSARRETASDVRVTFSYCDYRVTVRSEGTIEVEALPGDAPE